MTPFLHFRLWWRGTTPGTRLSAGGAAAAAVALLVWITIPTGPPSQVGLAAGTVSQGGSVGSGAGGSAGRAGGGAAGQPTGVSGTPAGGSVAPGSTGGAGGGAAPSGGLGGSTGVSGQPGPTTPGGGVTSAPTPVTGCPTTRPRVAVGVVLDDVAGLNSTFGIPSPNGQQGEFDAVFDSVNKSGAAGCVTLVPDYQTYNEFDASTGQADCLTFAQHKDFAVLNGFLPIGTDDCVLQHHIPLFELQPISGADVQKYLPYYFSASLEFQVLYRNFAHATKQMGVWDRQNGFQKLGIFYRDCQQDVNTALVSDLAEVGVPASAINRFDVGCPADFASPTSIEQAVLQFKAAGVTTVTIDNDLGDAQNLTKTAQAQGFHPRYVLADYGLVGETGSVQFQPDPTNFDNALAITPSLYGAVTSGLPETAGTKACDQVMTSHGQAAVLKSGSASYAGVVCDVTWMFAAALTNDASQASAGLASGLEKAGTVTFSYPFGPNIFTTPGTTFGGQEWRPVTFHASCACWKVDNPAFAPPF